MWYASFLAIVFLGISWTCSARSDFVPSLTNLRVYTLLPPLWVSDPGPLSIISLQSFIDALHRNEFPTGVGIFDSCAVAASSYMYARSGVCGGSYDKVMLFSRGYAKQARPKDGMPRCGGGVFSVYEYFKGGVITMPCVTFDYPDDREFFNFGQDIDQQCLITVYSQIRQQYPAASIILFGDCRGGLSALRFIATNPASIDTLILASPFLSVRDLSDQVADNYLQPLGKLGKKILYKFFSWWFPSYNAAKDTDISWLKKIQGKTIFIAHRLNDQVVPTHGIYHLVRILREHNVVYLFLTHDTSFPHSRLNGIVQFQQVLNAFLARHGCAYHQQLAMNGVSGLAEARKNSQIV